jgi:hypothetical protein
LKPTQRLTEYIKKNGFNKTSAELTQMFNPRATATWARSVAASKGLATKAVKDEHEALRKFCEDEGIPFEDVRHYWVKGKSYSIFTKKPEVDITQVTNELLEELKKRAPKYPAIKYPKITEGHLLVIDPADVHLGKLCSAYETGDEYNIEIAKKRVLEGVHGIIHKARGFNIEKILLISGNDKLHIDTPKSTTTAGTHQDSQLMWYDAYRFGVHLEIEVVETLLSIAPVSFQLDLSNHDYTNGFFLAQTIAAWFRNNKNIDFNISAAHRKYFKYGKNLIGTTHGDGAKETDLALLMAHEAAEEWNECKHRYWYCHHLHHKRSKDYMSVNVETLRSPSGTDSWHHRNGYQHAPKAIEGFIHHKEHGQIARLTHLF